MNFQEWLREQGSQKVINTFDDYIKNMKNGRGPGADKKAFNKYKTNRKFLLEESEILYRQLTDRKDNPRYTFIPFIETGIPKPGSDTPRPIAQSSIRDAIVQTLILEYLIAYRTYARSN